MCSLITIEHVPLGGGGSGFLGTSMCIFSSEITFLGTSGTLKKAVNFTFMHFEDMSAVLRH